MEGGEQLHEQETYRPCVEQHGGEFDHHRHSADSAGWAQGMSVDQCQTIQEMNDSQLVGAPVVAVMADVDMKGEDDVKSMVVDVQVVNEVKVVEMSTGKRKRGRPPRIQGKTATPPRQRKTKDEEDVCFICFDGGSLVLCDRRGCPKAYHPACIKRDEAFFRSKAKWNCGWHICSTCRKASYYMCYTCTYSLCKGCTKGADYVCIRGNKGLCGTCMRTIKLIENVAQGNKETVQVDFDDKTSWEYLFKVYWIYLKEKLSLTLDELTKAKNPWKGDEPTKAKSSWSGTGNMATKVEFSDELYHGNDEKGPCLDNYYRILEANHSKRRKANNQETYLNGKNYVGMEKSTVDKVTTLPEGTAWATKELLEFVAHMRNGDVSVLSQLDVQVLLLEYIKRNNLRDPQQKCQFVCDSRLLNLFGKTRVGHLEMLKLLEYHFHIKEKSSTDDTVRAGIADSVGIQIEPGMNDSELIMGNDRRRKTRKKTDGRGSLVNPSPDEYAAIDVHNINLLYLKRSWIENLMDDTEKFHEKIVGSFVRIRISDGDQKQEMCRLVQVVGTSKAAESYKVGMRSTDVMLEILNLDKKEVVSIDVISNQEISEDECRCLRQSMKCGLIKWLTVGEIQEKAMMLQAVKVSDWMEAEILRLNHLRDRASEKGHRKELRECVEKLELLKSPEERQRRLLEIPNVHADAKMNPIYLYEGDAGESDEKKQGDNVRRRNSGIGRRGEDLNFSLRGGLLNDMGNRAQNNLASTSEQTTNTSTTFYVDRDGTTRVHERVGESTWNQGGDALGFNSQNFDGPTSSATVGWNGQSMVRSDLVSGVSSQALSPSLSTGTELSANDIETEKLWHYQDPAGKIQGPFSMMQLQKWSANSFFRDVRVWRINEKQDDSILLTDALVGRFHKKTPLLHSSYLPPQEVRVSSYVPDKKWEHGLSLSTDASCLEDRKVDSCKLMQNDTSIDCNHNNEQVGKDRWGSHSSSWNAFVDIAIASGGDGQTESCLQGWELSKGKRPWAGQPQTCSSFLLPSGKLSETPLARGSGDAGDEKRIASPGNVNENSVRSKTIDCQTSVGASDVKQADSEGNSSQSSGQHWRPPPLNSSSSVLGSNSDFVSVAKSVETSKQNQEIDFSDLLSSTPKQNRESLKSQAAENNQSISSDVPVLDSGPSWSTASSLVVGGAQVPEVAGEWNGYSSATTKPSVEEWDSNPVSASSMKLTDGASDHAATPTSGNDQLAHSSPAQPVIDGSSWQAIIPEPNEFCSLVDESVSDLLAEVEAMESLGGLPSPTSKMRELAQDSDDDCFSPVEGFSPALDPGKSDAFSSTNDMQIPSQLTVADEQLRLSHVPSQPIISDKPLGVSQIISQLTVTDEPLKVSHMPSQSNVINKPLGLSHVSSHSTPINEPLAIPDAEVLNPEKSFAGQSSAGDGKLSDISVNQWKAGSDVHCPVSSVMDSSLGIAKGNLNLNPGVTSQGNLNVIQQHANPGNWGPQPRNGGERFTSPRDHRNYYNGRDSGFGRDRSSGNRQLFYGVVNGGGSFRALPRGQRVCKFYESGYCKKGASCNYWHPS